MRVYVSLRINHVEDKLSFLPFKTSIVSAHFQVNLERTFYNDRVAAAKITARDMNVTSLGSHPAKSRPVEMQYCFDFAQQVYLPSSPMQPGPIYFMTPRKCGLFGVCCPALPQQINFIIDEGMCCGKGSNSVISYLHFFFQNYGLGEQFLVLHCDNCSGQNKNKFLMWYMMWRVIHGLHDKISVNFMISGHTKFAPDWSFGLLKQNCRRMEVHCLDDMARAVSESAETLNRPQLVGREDGTVIVPTYNWQTFLSPYFRKVDGIKSLHHFTFQAGSTAVTMRATEGEEQSLQLLKDPDQLHPHHSPSTHHPSRSFGGAEKILEGQHPRVCR